MKSGKATSSGCTDRPSTTAVWGARFKDPLDDGIKAFLASVDFDSRLAWADIAGSMAHAIMLGRTGIVSQDVGKALTDGLRALWNRLSSGEVTLSPEQEDVHMNIEALLRQEIGPLADHLHTGRSRNDQVALDLRILTRELMVSTMDGIMGLKRALLTLARSNPDLVVQGHTHMQPAQPILLAHSLLAHCSRLDRDMARVADAFGRVNVSPLGAGALAGSSLSISPVMTAELLGFEAVFDNSVDAVSDRDFVLESLSCLTNLMLHLSGLCEELVLWTSPHLGWAVAGDQASTGSSMMPQKRNPDVPELVRGKTGRVLGSLVGVATMLKGLPLAYNKDLQEDKEAMFDAFDTAVACLHALSYYIGTLRMVPRNIVISPSSLATDLAEDLVKRGMAFRQAHRTVGALVLHCEEKGISLDQLDTTTLKGHSEMFDEKSLSLLTPEGSVGAKVTPGGTGPAQVKAALAKAFDRLEADTGRLEVHHAPTIKVRALLEGRVLDGCSGHKG